MGEEGKEDQNMVEKSKQENKPEKEKRTLGEILKEEGLIEEEPPEEEESKEEKKSKMDILDELSIKVEKLDGKLEMEKEARKTLEERLSTMNESIGDLRRMILDREKDITKMEKDVEELREMLTYLEPRKIEKRFEKFMVDLERKEAQIEKLDVLTKDLKERLKRLEETFAKLGNVEALANVLEKVRDAEKQIEEEKREIDRIAGKVETIFSDISENLTAIRDEREKIHKVDDLVTDLVKTVDKLQMKIENDVVTKKDFEDVKNKIESEIKEHIQSEIEKVALSQKSIEELVHEKKMLEQSLQTVENDYRSGKISADSFEEMRRGIQVKMKVIDGILERIGRETLAKTMGKYAKIVDEVAKKVDNAVTREELQPILEEMKNINEKLDKIPIEKMLSMQLELESSKVDRDEFNRFKKWVEMMLERNLTLLKKFVSEEM